MCRIMMKCIFIVHSPKADMALLTWIIWVFTSNSFEKGIFVLFIRTIGYTEITALLTLDNM